MIFFLTMTININKQIQSLKFSPEYINQMLKILKIKESYITKYKVEAQKRGQNGRKIARIRNKNFLTKRIEDVYNINTTSPINVNVYTGKEERKKIIVATTPFNFHVHIPYKIKQ